MKEKVTAILRRFKALEGSPDSKAGMARFGINTDKTFAISTPALRKMAKEIGTDHPLALALWDEGYRDSRLLAGMIADPDQLDLATIDKWTAEIDSWDVCDSTCQNLFRYSPLAWSLIERYAYSENEWIRRTGFALLAALASGDKQATDEQFLSRLPLIEHYSTDARNFVRKAVNWALRQIGKRNKRLYPHALKLAEKLKNSTDKTARWIGSDAYRELISPKIIVRIKD